MFFLNYIHVLHIDIHIQNDSTCTYIFQECESKSYFDWRFGQCLSVGTKQSLPHGLPWQEMDTDPQLPRGL